MNIEPIQLKKPTFLLKYYLCRQYVKLYPQEMFIAVCGSLGKTTTVRFSQAVLSQKFKTLTTTTNSNKDHALEVLSTILKINPSYKKVILELGINMEGEMDFYNSMILPKVVIATRITSESNYFESTDQVLKETAKFLSALSKDGVGILNWDDVNSKKLSQTTQASVIYYGTDAKNCTVWAGNMRIENFKTTFELNLGVERVKVELSMLGTHLIYPALAAAALGIVYDIPLTKIKLALESVEAQEHQLQLLFGPNNSLILDDTFSSSPAEVESAIDTLVQIPARRRILILGDMNNPVRYCADDYRKIAEKIYKEKLDFVFLGAGFVKQVSDKLKDLGFWEERIGDNLKNSQLVSKLLKTLGKADICLIKGSKAVRLDEVVKRIAKNK